MKASKIIIYLSTILIFFSSCQDVIELDLDSVTPRLVVEGSISDSPGPYTVTLTETSDFYNDNTFNPRTGAQVVIYDEVGTRDTLVEINPGVYQTTYIQGVRGIVYSLEINSEGNNYLASSRIPDQINPLDSVTTQFEEESIFRDEGYYARAYTQDVLGVANYYRYKVFVNGKVYIFNYDNDEDNEEDDNLYLSQDKFSDGQYLDYDFPQKLVVGDSVEVQMYHINQGSFDYYRTILDAIGTGGVAPSNPISNFGNQALGNFNAYVVFSKTIQVTQ